MAQSIPKQLAAYIDETLGVHNTGDVSQFFEDGSLRAFQPGDSVFAYSIACSISNYESNEHDDYLMNVWNEIASDIEGLSKVRNIIDDFVMPEHWLSVGNKVFWTDPDDGICSGEYTVVGVKGDIYLLDCKGSEVEVTAEELSEVE